MSGGEASHLVACLPCRERAEPCAADSREAREHRPEETGGRRGRNTRNGSGSEGAKALPPSLAMPGPGLESQRLDLESRGWGFSQPMCPLPPVFLRKFQRARQLYSTPHLGLGAGSAGNARLLWGLPFAHLCQAFGSDRLFCMILVRGKRCSSFNSAVPDFV